MAQVFTVVVVAVVLGGVGLSLPALAQQDGEPPMTDANGCVWSWGYTPCSAPCGGGTFTRFKQVLSRPNGVDCVPEANQTNIICNTIACSSAGSEAQPEMRVLDGNIVFSVTQGKDIVAERGQDTISLFDGVDRQLKSLMSSLDSQMASVTSAISDVVQQMDTNSNEHERTLTSTASSLAEATATQINSTERLVARISTGVSEQLSRVSSAARAQLTLISAVSSSTDTVQFNTLPLLSGAIVSNANNHNQLSSLVTEVSDITASVSTHVEGQPDFTTMSFGRDCVESGGGGGEYYFTDALGTKWTIPYDQDSLTVQFDPETRRGFAFRPSEGAGSYWYLSLTGATGIACQHFGAEDDAVRSWYLRDATDGGNGYYSTWGVPRGTNVPTMILKMEYAHCSPDDVNQGVCTHPVHLGSCSSYRILCFP